jgi:serine/threonine-protein kinase
VRVEAARLRARLREYYEVTPPERVRIDLPKGGYLPRFISVEEASGQMESDLSILVAPFRSLSPDPRDQSFCDGLTEEVVDRLAQDRRLRVITQSAVAWIEHSGRKPRFLLEGSVRKADAEIRLALHLMEVTGDGSMRLSKIYQSTIHDVFTIQERLAEEIRDDIIAALDPDETGDGSIN